MSKPNEKPQYTWLNQLASEKVDGRVLFATDDWFATAENLLKVEPPTWKEGVFTEYGKWMDGWETRRKRQLGHDWCVIQLGLSGIIHGFNVDTAYFTGNYPPNVSIQAACLDQDYPARPTKQMGTAATESELSEIKKLDSELDRPTILTADEKGILQLPGFDWAVFRLGHPGRVIEIEIDTNHFKGNFPDNCRIEACLINKDQDDDLMKHVREARWSVLLPPQKLSANKRHFFRSEVVGSEVVDHVRLSMAPDGGISRLKIQGFREECASAKL